MNFFETKQMRNCNNEVVFFKVKTFNCLQKLKLFSFALRI